MNMEAITIINYQEISSLRDKYSEHKFFCGIIQKSATLPEQVQANIIKIIQVLDSNKIDKQELSNHIKYGLDESPSLRSLTWKVLLNYLPDDISKWEESLCSKRKDYSKLKFDLMKKDKILKSKIDKLNNKDTLIEISSIEKTEKKGSSDNITNPLQ